ncbi:hypothetical protein V6N12_065172 [Hibiscus sabdariffa]|uniref:Uncharacterized protein n=1 Tax=Hibiscus sabdariffa TaxID=183260 RepID=A0ABR2G9E0_9ROSI
MAESRPAHCEESLVSHLINMEDREWNTNRLNELFTSSNVKQIISLPIGGPFVKDELVWHLNKNGFYTVKSGYYLLSNLQSSTTTPNFSC